MTAQALAGLLADETRLRVFSAIVLGAATPPEIASATGAKAKDVALALRKLTGGGLVVDDGGELRAATGRFKEVLRSAAGAERTVTDHGTGDERTESLLRTFVDGDRLLGIPSQLVRRRTVLAHLAHRSFRPGERYPERAVNDILRAWSEGSGTDHVAIRRYLIELDVLDRADGHYWLRPEAETAS
ncbi:DUF2087 domain-containing protein [Streptomyces sp. JJ66]|uniref:DUF2087 domain-containing protein n=1 Tax=Streptomyces sp. JJ66 TaxID=2803843 RepID=UPI001C57A5A1|nr:DUF2087 domain-containing protein [Streptomyces sp. JJ66]MBW1603872.1 DUF2087 domain-containing protein [Streptomyces sp. JJ66]